MILTSLVSTAKGRRPARARRPERQPRSPKPSRKAGRRNGLPAEAWQAWHERQTF